VSKISFHVVVVCQMSVG